MLKLLLCVLIAHQLRLIEIHLTAGGKDRLQSVPFYLDFGYDKVLLNEKRVNCNETYGCSFTDSKIKHDMYDTVEYRYRDAVINLFVLDENSNRYVEMKVGVRVGDMPYNIIGLNSDSILKSSLESRLLVLDLVSKQIRVNDNEPGDVLSETFNNSRRMYYLQAGLGYMDGSGRSNSVKHADNANLCFHDRDITAQQNFFLSGKPRLMTSFNKFVNTTKTDRSPSSIAKYVIASRVSPFAFEITFDSQIADIYESPFEMYNPKYYTHCDLLIGELAILRSGIKLILQADETQTRLIVKIQNSQNEYIVKRIFHYFYLIYAIAMFCIVMGVLHYLKYIYTDEERMAIGSIKPVIGFAFEKGFT